MIEIREAGTCAEWDRYVEAAPHATCYHASAWTEIVRHAYHVRVFRLVARDAPGAAIRGVLPLFVIPRPFGRYVTTGPFGSYGPVLADDDATAAELLDTARGITHRVGAHYLHVKGLGDAPPPAGFARQDLWVRALLPLEGGPQHVWTLLRKGVRAAVRQAAKNGFSVHRGHDELAGFYDVLAENMHRKGAPIYGLTFLRSLIDAFGDRADVVTLHEGGRTVSGALTLAHHGVLYVPFASSRAAVFPKRPNNLLYWKLVEMACAADFHTFDFGSSMRGTSTLAFKQHWGARIEPIASYVYAAHPTEHEPDLGPSSAAVQKGVALWKKLPRGVADACGPIVCRFML